MHKLLHTSTHANPARWVGLGEAKTSMLICYKYSIMNLFPKDLFRPLCICANLCWWWWWCCFILFGPDEARNLVVLENRKGRSLGVS